MLLDSFLLSPPLPMLLALLIVAGFAHVGWRFARLGRTNASSNEVAAAFIAVCGCVGAGAYLLACAQLSRVSVLRPMAWAFALVGLYEIIRFGRQRLLLLASYFAQLRMGSGPGMRSGLNLAIATICALGLTSLCPATDADSLAYHLAVPASWLEHGGMHFQPGWLTMRLAGLGEALNLVGLAAGTDCIGAVLQFSGLLVAVCAMTSVATSNKGKIVAIQLRCESRPSDGWPSTAYGA